VRCWADGPALLGPSATIVLEMSVEDLREAIRLGIENELALGWSSGQLDGYRFSRQSDTQQDARGGAATPVERSTRPSRASRSAEGRPFLVHRDYRKLSGKGRRATRFAQLHTPGKA
jgi:hypothetical protein